MAISLHDIVLPAEIYGRCGSKTRIFALEKAGAFPRRQYLDSESPCPRKPFWLRSEVDAWLQARVDQAADARARAGLTGARLVEARHLKAA